MLAIELPLPFSRSTSISLSPSSPFLSTELRLHLDLVNLQISTTSKPNHHGRGYTTGYTDCLPQCWHHKIVIPTNYKDRRSPSQYLSMQMTKNVFPILFLTFFLFLLFKSLAIVQDWKQADAHASLHLKRSTKWYKQPPTLNSKVTYLKQANLIALSSVDIIKSWYWWITRVKYLLHDIL